MSALCESGHLPQVGEYVIHPGHQRDMSLDVEESRPGVRNRGGEPLAMRVRSHPVLGALPDADRNLDPCQV